MTNLGELAERVLGHARGPCVVTVRRENSANVRWAAGAMTTTGWTEGQRVTVVAVREKAGGTSAGVVSRAGALDDAALAELVGAAEDAAAQAEPAEDGLIPVSAGSSVAAGWNDPVPGLPSRLFEELAGHLGRAFRRAAAQRFELFGYAEQTVGATVLASTTGLRGRHNHTSSHLQMTGRSLEGPQSVWSGIADQEFSVDTLEAVYADVERQLRWAARTVELPAGHYDTVLPPAAVADLMAHAYWAAGARAAAEGRSVFSAPDGGTRIGERLTGHPLTLRGDPAEPGLECAPFLITAGSDDLVSVFDNGLPLSRTAWIDAGVLTALPQTRYSAGLTGSAATGHIDNLILESDHGRGDVPDLVREVEDGLLVSTLWYVREVDTPRLLLTGLTRDGVYLIKGGEIVGSVPNFRFNESPVELLRRIISVGDTVPTRPREWGDAFSRCAMPALRIDGFNLSSVSRAT